MAVLFSQAAEGSTGGYKLKALYQTKQPPKKINSATAHLLDQRLHVADIILERALSVSRQLIFRFWLPPFKGLGAGNVAAVFQLARMHAEVAIRGVHQV